MKGEKGFALVLTLVITSLMLAIVAEMIHEVYVDTSLSRSFRDGQQASLLAESGITGGLKLLQVSLSGRSYSALTDRWAAPVKLDDETGSIEITISEETGKVNLNGLVTPSGEIDQYTLSVLKRLGKRLQIPEENWNALADWLDNDDMPRSGGAESTYYKSLKPHYSASNGKMRTISELTLVRGFTPQMVAQLRPFTTIWPEQQQLLRVNINTAPKEVIAVLDDSIDDRMAEKIMEERKLKAFTAPGEMSRVVDGNLSFKLSKVIRCDGEIYRITSVSRVKETARTVEVVALLGGGILSWQEY